MGELLDGYVDKVLKSLFGRVIRDFVSANGHRVIYIGKICNVFQCWKCKA